MKDRRSETAPAVRMVIPDVSEQRFDCQSCTRCCRDLVVHLTAADRARIDQQGWGERLGLPAYARLGRSYALGHTPDGACVFLRKDNLCRIHAEFGFDQKPLACQLFPVTLEPVPGGVGLGETDSVHVSLRFDCPSVARTTGRRLGAHRPELERMIGELATVAPETLRSSRAAFEWCSGRPAEAGEILAVMAHVDAWLRNGDRSVQDRMLGLASFLETFTAADIERVRGERLVELVSMLMEDLPNVIPDLKEGPPPSERTLRLFRQAVFAHCENVTFAQAKASPLSRVSQRFSQLRRARRLMVGKGVIPALVPGADVGTFAQIERCRPAAGMDAVACDGLIMRYLRIRLLGMTVFGGGYYGWPVLDGLGALLLSLAVIGWVARYMAIRDGRETFGFDDVAVAIGVVHRNAGRSPELGGRTSLMRQGYLGQDGGIARLLMKYPCA